LDTKYLTEVRSDSHGERMFVATGLVRMEGMYGVM
jgi:hypothetical protein